MSYEKICSNVYKHGNVYYIIKKVHGEKKRLKFDNKMETLNALKDLDNNKWDIESMLKYKKNFMPIKSEVKKTNEENSSRYIKKCKKGYYILKTLGNIRYTKGYFDTLEEAETQRDKYEKDWDKITEDCTKQLTINKNKQKQKTRKTPPKAKKPSNINETIILPSEYMSEFKKQAKEYGMSVHDYVLLMVEVGRQQFNRLNFIPEYEKR